MSGVGHLLQVLKLASFSALVGLLLALAASPLACAIAAVAVFFVLLGLLT